MAQRKQPQQKSRQPKSSKADRANGALEIKVLNADGKTVETIALDDLIAKAETHPHLLYQAVTAAQANLRQGNAKAKNRSEVSGGGKKPWRQKGTGRARHGSIRSPLWRKGGATFGPVPRDYTITLPKRMKLAALVAGLKDKAQEGKFFMVEQFASKNGKTKEIAGMRSKLNLNKCVVITDNRDEMTARSARNIQDLTVTTSAMVAPFDVLAKDECVVTRAGYAKLLERLKAGLS